MTSEEMIELLIKTKKDIELQIKRLQKSCCESGRVKLDKYPYWDNPYYVAIQRENIDGVPYNEKRFMPVIVASTREKAVEAIPQLIAELQELYVMNK